jgi:hypothetical protein
VAVWFTGVEYALHGDGVVGIGIQISTFGLV